MTPADALLLVAAAFLGGALNAVAGGGAFFSFPALLAVGVAPIPANATSALVLWPASLASALGYREDFGSVERLAAWFGVVSLVGGAAGALILLGTPPVVFARLVPWLLLFATLVFAAGGPLVKRMRRTGKDESDLTGGALAGFALLQLVISVYGGYFGGGMGILMLALFSLLGVESVHAMNGLKALLAVVIHAVAVATFIAAKIVVWPLALLMVASAAVGGYAGARGARRVDSRVVRGFVVTVGLALSAYYFANPPG